ncbi:hypothetical protein UFOVP509_33 [uncultured Caudovirales phage]|uniref:Uncharacterized protein n=1 Tax=uncultured Caudovirales phage TaxID=2100421 RepID=A0A6J5MQ68_9CAUD|nr:hypothetical protein UFOVP509_33 [uncultured Caudovirales phage]
MTKTHVHAFTLGKSGKVEVCKCGRFRHVITAATEIFIERPMMTSPEGDDMTQTKTIRITPRNGYRQHDGITEYQTCDRCGLTTGAGIQTSYDETYYAGDPRVCPRCAERGTDGLMCLEVAR